MAPERWLPVTDWPGYEVSDLGRVRSWKGGQTSPRLLRAHACRRGYHRVQLCCRSQRRTMLVHRLVLMAFVGASPEGHECRHLNGDPSDNRLANLAWGTSAENERDKRSHGTIGTSISEETARDILAYEGTHAEARRAFGVSYLVAYRIRTGARWKHLERPGSA